MCTDEQHSAVLTKLDHIDEHLRRRKPEFLTVPISDSLSFIIDYKARKYLFVRSQVALTLLIGTENTVNLPANVWYPFMFRPGDPVVTSGFGNVSTILTTLATDEPINSLLASITGTAQVNIAQTGGVPTQMGTADGVAQTNIPEEGIALYNGGTTFDRWREVNGQGDNSSFGTAAVGAYIFNGANWDRWRGFQGVADTSTGGRATATITAAGSLNVKSSPGRLARVLITAAGTASITFFDNSAGNSTGNIIGITPATTSPGQVFDFGLPALAGISAVGGAGSPGVTVSYY